MKVMLITGASRGIGAATARLAAENGFAVAVNYHRSREEAERLVDEIRSQGGRAVALGADASREEDILLLFAETERLLGGLDCLVNNAGILERQGRVEGMESDRLQRVFTTNIIGPFLCAREAVRRMSIRHGGRGGTIVNVSSLAAKTGAPNEYVDYAASKGALDTLTVGLAREVAAEGIRVNGVRPAFIHTGIHAAGGEPGRIERLQGNIPLQRGGTPREVAEAILWLASDKSAYTTGTFIDVTGGVR